jgi:hypothetical protein
MPDVPFTRPTIVAAVALLSDRLTQAPFNHMVLRIGLENDIPSDTSLSVAKKADRLGRIVMQRPDEPVETLGVLTECERVVYLTAEELESVSFGTRPTPAHAPERVGARYQLGSVRVRACAAAQRLCVGQRYYPLAVACRGVHRLYRDGRF